MEKLKWKYDKRIQVWWVDQKDIQSDFEIKKFGDKWRLLQNDAYVVDLNKLKSAKAVAQLIYEG